MGLGRSRRDRAAGTGAGARGSTAGHAACRAAQMPRVRSPNNSARTGTPAVGVGTRRSCKPVGSAVARLSPDSRAGCQQGPAEPLEPHVDWPGDQDDDVGAGREHGKIPPENLPNPSLHPVPRDRIPGFPADGKPQATEAKIVRLHDQRGNLRAYSPAGAEDRIKFVLLVEPLGSPESLHASDAEALPPLGPAPLQYQAAARRLHSGAKTVSALPAPVVWLERPLHRGSLSLVKPETIEQPDGCVKPGISSQIGHH